MSNISPIYLISSERSGTNLFRRRFTEHQNIYFGPAPAHFFKHLYPIEPLYGDLAQDDNFLELISDALNLVYIHFSPWEIKFTKNEILNDYSKLYTQRNIILLAHYLMTQYAVFKGFKSYLCKDNHLWQFTYPILKYIPNARFIYMHRDPRDVVLSQLKRRATTDSIYALAALWKSEQLQSFQVMRELEEKIMRVSYENLLQNEYAVIKQCCEFLGIDMLEERRDIEGFDTGSREEWQNLDKKTITDNFNKYKTQFSKRKIAIIEGICWNGMNFLKYAPENTAQPKISIIARYLDLAWGRGMQILRYLLSLANPKYRSVNAASRFRRKLKSKR